MCQSSKTEQKQDQMTSWEFKCHATLCLRIYQMTPDTIRIENPLNEWFWSYLIFIYIFSSFPFENIFLWLLAFCFVNYHQDLPISKRCGWISKRCDCSFEWCLNRFKTMKNEDLMQTVKWRLNCFLSDSQKTSVWRIMMRFCLTKSICIWLIFPLIVWHCTF